MKIARLAALVACGSMCPSSSPVAAQAPVAVVEEVIGNPQGVEFMDYVESGKVIRLTARDSIVLGYMNSCVRETITGGTVTVGTERSHVESGKVESTTVACDAGRMLLTAQQHHSAGMIFRSGPLLTAEPTSVPEPQLTLYGASPIVELRGGGTLVIERIDQSGERYEMTIGTRDLVRGAFYDFAMLGKALTPGGIYRAGLGAQEIVFKIDPRARPGQAPMVGRLLRFEPAS